MIYHVWYCFVGTSWIPPQDDRHLCWFDRTRIGIYAGSHVPNEKSTIYMHRGIIITKSTHFDYHLRISEVRCWLKDWYWLHYWPWAIDACRDPWRWKRPWWIGEEGKSCSKWRWKGKPDTSRVLIWLIVSLLIGGRNGAGVHRGFYSRVE